MSDVATSSWQPRGAWNGLLAAGPFGARGKAGVSIETREGLGIACLIAPEADRDALARALQERLGLALPSEPRIASGAGHSLVWAGVEQWLLIAEERRGFAELLGSFSGLAAISEQSDSRAALRLSGPMIRHALAKGCMLDLHPSALPVGAAALTSIAYMGVHVWRVADDPSSGDAVFEIMVARSMAGSFWSWLSASAAEFGCVVTATGRG